MQEENITVYFAENYCHSWRNIDRNIFVAQFFNFNLGEHRQKAFVKNVEALEKYRIKTVILHFRDAIGLQAPEELDWITNVAFPKYQTLYIEKVICIFPDNHIAKLGARTWINIAEQFGFTLLNADSLESAYNM